MRFPSATAAALGLLGSTVVALYPETPVDAIQLEARDPQQQQARGITDTLQPHVRAIRHADARSDGHHEPMALHWPSPSLDRPSDTRFSNAMLPSHVRPSPPVSRLSLRSIVEGDVPSTSHQSPPPAVHSTKSGPEPDGPLPGHRTGAKSASTTEPIYGPPLKSQRSGLTGFLDRTIGPGRKVSRTRESRGAEHSQLRPRSTGSNRSSGSGNRPSTSQPQTRTAPTMFQRLSSFSASMFARSKSANTVLERSKSEGQKPAHKSIFAPSRGRRPENYPTAMTGQPSASISEWTGQGRSRPTSGSGSRDKSFINEPSWYSRKLPVPTVPPHPGIHHADWYSQGHKKRGLQARSVRPMQHQARSSFGSSFSLFGSARGSPKGNPKAPEPYRPFGEAHMPPTSKFASPYRDPKKYPTRMSGQPAPASTWTVRKDAPASTSVSPMREPSKPTTVLNEPQWYWPKQTGSQKGPKKRGLESRSQHAHVKLLRARASDDEHPTGRPWPLPDLNEPYPKRKAPDAGPSEPGLKKPKPEPVEWPQSSRPQPPVPRVNRLLKKLKLTPLETEVRSPRPGTPLLTPKVEPESPPPVPIGHGSPGMGMLQLAPESPSEVTSPLKPKSPPKPKSPRPGLRIIPRSEPSSKKPRLEIQVPKPGSSLKRWASGSLSKKELGSSSKGRSGSTSLALVPYSRSLSMPEHSTVNVSPSPGSLTSSYQRSAVIDSGISGMQRAVKSQKLAKTNTDYVEDMFRKLQLEEKEKSQGKKSQSGKSSKGSKSQHKQQSRQSQPI